MVSLNSLKNEIELIKKRNQRVEADKAWETSKTRIVLISVMTYLIISLYFLYMGIPRPFMNAFVPA